MFYYEVKIHGVFHSLHRTVYFHSPQLIHLNTLTNALHASLGDAAPSSEEIKHIISFQQVTFQEYELGTQLQDKEKFNIHIRCNKCNGDLIETDLWMGQGSAFLNIKCLNESCMNSLQNSHDSETLDELVNTKPFPK